jgi:hypothetical protein
MRYLLLKAKRMVVTNTEYAAFQKPGRPRKCHLLLGAVHLFANSLTRHANWAYRITRSSFRRLGSADDLKTSISKVTIKGEYRDNP